MNKYYIYRKEVTREVEWIGDGYFEERIANKNWECLGYVEKAKDVYKLFSYRSGRPYKILEANDFNEIHNYPGVYYIFYRGNKKVKYNDIIKNFYKEPKEPRYVYRKDPVPVFKGFRFYAYRCLPKVKDEISQNEIKELRDNYPFAKIKIQRAKRKASNMPNTWDDILKSNYKNRNWKQYRKTEWK